MPKLDHLRPSGLHHNPAYSHVVTATGARTIYISGQVSVDEEGRIVGEGDLAAQTTQVMQNLGHALKAAGASYSNIVKITTFVVGYKPELRPIIGKARSAFFEGMEPPASRAGMADRDRGDRGRGLNARLRTYGHVAQELQRLVGPVSRHEEMVVMEGRNRIHADAGFGEARGDGRQETHSIKRGVNRQRDQARGECVA